MFRSAGRLLPRLALLLLLIDPGDARSTGFGDPDRWIDQESKTVLRAPDFYFEFEVKRLASELKAAWEAVPPKSSDGGEVGTGYDNQAEEADYADFDAALKEGTIKPGDPESARQANAVARAFLLTPGANSVADENAPPADVTKIPTALSSEFPSEFGDYHRGAYWFRQKQYAEAAKNWEALLARPDAERKYRSVWAAFMLGRAAFYQQQWDAACTWFAKAREFAKAGNRDGIGLAASSLGLEAQAHLEAERYDKAARLFLEQMAAGDVSAVYSLRDVVATMFMKEYDLQKAVKDPVLQRLLTACCVAGLGPFSSWMYYEYESSQPKAEERASSQWIRALESTNATNVWDADRVAWIAYLHGDFAKAARWLARAKQDSAYTAWLRAKLLLREGKMDTAAKLMARVVREVPDTDLETRGYAEGEFPQAVSAKGDLGLVQFTRGDYISALQLFIDGGHAQDADYIAEAILTTKELTDFLDRQAPGSAAEAAQDATPAEKAKEDEIRGSNREEERRYIIESLRTTLARRYIRAGEFANARKYLTEAMQSTLDKYEELLNRTRDKSLDKPARIAAFQELARYTKEECVGIFEITDVELQSARLSGRSVEKEEYPKQTLKFGDKLHLAVPITPQERERLRRNSYKVLRHSLALHIAADHAWSAALLMPDNDEATAEWLNEAGTWLKLRDIPAADRFYQALERRCANTELGKEAVRRHWFVPQSEPANTEQN